MPCSPIRTMDEVFDSPEGAALVDEVDYPARGGSLRLVANPLRFDGRRLPTRLAPPVLGADSEDVLSMRSYELMIIEPQQPDGDGLAMLRRFKHESGLMMPVIKCTSPSPGLRDPTHRGENVGAVRFADVGAAWPQHWWFASEH